MVKQLLPLDTKKSFIPHHSASDWDIRFPTKYTITTETYISPPTSLRHDYPGGTAYNLFLCKNSAALQVTEGRLQTYLRMNNTTRPFYLCFRNILASGTPNLSSCYYAYFGMQSTEWYFYEYKSGTQKRAWSRTKQLQEINTWYNTRLSWWYAWDVLNVSLELEVDGQWIQQGDLITVANDLFKTETHQRCGIGSSLSAAAHKAYFDNTSIWEYVP